MFEVTVLSIADQIGLELSGIPYFWNLDAQVTEVFGPNYMGTRPGLGEGYRVTGGAVANWTIPNDFNRYEWDILNSTDYPYNYVGNDGVMRSEPNSNRSPFYFSFPPFVLEDGTDGIYQGFSYTCEEDIEKVFEYVL